MKSHIEIIESKLYAGAVADEIVACIGEAIEERGQCSIALAGGSTPSAIYRALTKPPRVESVAWGKVMLFWGDERWVPRDDNQSNYRMVQETLLSQLGTNAPKVFPVDTNLKTPQLAARAYHDLLIKELGQNPSFDLVLLGIGEDGHTASIFPGSTVLSSPNSELCSAVTHPEENKPRITLTPAALLSAKRMLFLAKGESKASIVQRVLEGNEDTSLIPARIFLQRQERVDFFLDSEAGTKLTKRTT
ncbi:MAG: 6-phosphogluconolactonase [Oligoflexia bacterium]|nr:6-phosphogluconolactonase [Oligoflexia bacterium]